MMGNAIDAGLSRRRKVSSFSAWLARFAMRLFGWRIVGEPPAVPKYVLIAAPHTTNWDFPIMLAVDFAFKIASVWMGKDSLFRGPLGSYFRHMGGIPIDRSSNHSVVEQAVAAFQRNESMVMTIPPEGTRKRTDHWRTGFYYIALGAQVPMVFGFIDFKRKVAGVGPMLMPSGDIGADMVIIRDFYKEIEGKYPEQASEIIVTTTGP